MAQSMSPELAQAVLAFQQQHPDFDLSSGFNPYGAVARYRGSDPSAIPDFLKLITQLDHAGYHLNSTGNAQQDMALWKKIAMGAAAVAAPVGGYAALGGFSAPAAATTVPAVAAGTEAATDPSFIRKAVNGAENTALGGGADWLKLLAPLTSLATTLKSNTNHGINPAYSDQIKQLLDLQVNKAKDAEPVRQAALKLAMSLAPTANNSPRLAAANQAALTPRPQQQTDPQVADAVRRLMGAA